MIHRSCPAAATSGGGSSVMAANDSRSSSPGAETSATKHTRITTSLPTALLAARDAFPRGGHFGVDKADIRIDSGVKSECYVAARSNACPALGGAVGNLERGQRVEVHDGRRPRLSLRSPNKVDDLGRRYGEPLRGAAGGIEHKQEWLGTDGNRRARAQGNQQGRQFH